MKPHILCIRDMKKYYAWFERDSFRLSTNGLNIFLCGNSLELFQIVFDKKAQGLTRGCSESWGWPGGVQLSPTSALLS